MLSHDARKNIFLVEDDRETTYKVCEKNFTPASSQTRELSSLLFFQRELSRISETCKFSPTMHHVNMFMIAPLEMQAHVRDRMKFIPYSTMELIQNVWKIYLAIKSSITARLHSKRSF